MQLTKNRLRQIIKEELGRVLSEQVDIGSLAVPTAPRRRPSPAPVEIPPDMESEGPKPKRLGKIYYLLFNTLSTDEARKAHTNPGKYSWDNSVNKLVRDSVGDNSTRVTFSVENGRVDRRTIQIQGVSQPLTEDQIGILSQALNVPLRDSSRSGPVEDGVYFVDTGVPVSKFEFDKRGSTRP
jgi:hypothetical protein